MNTQIQVGTATAVPGTIQIGRWDAFVHPTGHTEFFPVIIAQGREPGPCFWLTAGIHGPEHTGPVVLYGLLKEGLLATLKGHDRGDTCLIPGRSADALLCALSCGCEPEPSLA